jgi:DNA-nicking Smr family endonuclease
MDPRQLKKFRSGEMRPTATLDLHGYQLLEARDEFFSFMDSVADTHKCVLVVTGVGSGRLREGLKYWLMDHPAVLSTSPAQPRHGGDGAVYVLLKTRRAE